MPVEHPKKRKLLENEKRTLEQAISSAKKNKGNEASVQEWESRIAKINEKLASPAPRQSGAATAREGK